jgi:uncharacterized membrane protein
MLMTETLSESPPAESPRAAWTRRLSWSRVRRQKLIDRAIRAIPWVLGALFGAVALHLLTILALPTLWPGAPYRALAAALPLGKTAILPRPDPDSLGAAFPDPFAAMALCRFDLSQGSARIRAEADGAHPFSISVRLTDGTTIFSGNDRDTPSGRFNIRIVTQKQADAEDVSQNSGGEAAPNSAPALGQSGARDDELRLTSPNLRGFVVFRALASREEDYDAARSALTTARCSAETPSP